MSVSAGKGTIEIRQVKVSFERWGSRTDALDTLSFSVPAGQWLILVGPNGSGKSTLLKVLSGRLAPDSGQVSINGCSILGLPADQLSQAVFLVHQDPLLGSAPLLTVYENLLVADHAAYGKRIAKRELAAKYLQLLEPVGLADRIRQPVKTLSGGERQLLALLIAGLRPASVILLDEPLSALDPEKAGTCIEQIEALHRLGKTVIQVTHNAELAGSLGDRTIALQGGRLVLDESDQCSRETMTSWWRTGA